MGCVVRVPSAVLTRVISPPLPSALPEQVIHVAQLPVAVPAVPAPQASQLPISTVAVAAPLTRVTPPC